MYVSYFDFFTHILLLLQSRTNEIENHQAKYDIAGTISTGFPEDLQGQVLRTELRSFPGHAYDVSILHGKIEPSVSRRHAVKDR